jgi:hypothetical protein
MGVHTFCCAAKEMVSYGEEKFVWWQGAFGDQWPVREEEHCEEEPQDDGGREK